MGVLVETVSEGGKSHFRQQGGNSLILTYR
jgi:hypothetical protein